MSDAIPLWLALTIVGLFAFSPASLTVAIRAIEREAAKPDYSPPTAEQMHTRERRVTYVLLGFASVIAAVVGYLRGGLLSAAFSFAVAVIACGVAISLQRRRWRR